MARAQSLTKLPLDEWARLLGVQPLHFNGVTIPSIAARTCAAAWLQHPWQEADAASREDIAQAIAEAESNIERALGYRLLPSWEEDEWAKTQRPFKPEGYQAPWDVRYMREAIETKWRHFITGGIRSQDLIAAARPITWSDPDGDSYPELGTVSAPTVALNPAEVRVYFPGHSGEEEWEIRPVHVVIAGGTATVTFRRELCVLEDIQEEISNSGLQAVDGQDDANFLTEVDLYRVYNDPQRQVMFLWEPFDICDCGTSGCTTCSFSYQYGCLHSRGPRQLSLVAYTPATWSATTKTFTQAPWSVARQPDVVRLWYYAGLRDPAQRVPDITMTLMWARTVAYYAASLLDRPPCACTNQARFEHWQEDLAYVRGSDQLVQYSATQADLDNPFGTRRGAVQAWKQVVSFSEAASRSTVLI